MKRSYRRAVRASWAGLRAWVGIDRDLFYDELGWLLRIELTLLIGHSARRHFLGARRKPSLAATVEAWQEYAPKRLQLPHPSSRSQPWFKRHPWLERQLVPVLRTRIAALSAR